MSGSVLGTDISKGCFDALLLTEFRQVHQVLGNDEEGFGQLCGWLGEETVEDLRVCLEATGSYGDALAHHLHERGYDVRILTPRSVKHFAELRQLLREIDSLKAQCAEEKNRRRASAQRLAAKRQPPKAIICACMRKLVHIVFGV